MIFRKSVDSTVTFEYERRRDFQCERVSFLVSSFDDLWHPERLASLVTKCRSLTLDPRDELNEDEWESWHIVSISEGPDAWVLLEDSQTELYDAAKLALEALEVRDNRLDNHQQLALDALKSVVERAKVEEA